MSQLREGETVNQLDAHTSGVAQFVALYARPLMKDKIVISVLGNRHSGKSTTWNTLFRKTVRTGPLLRRLDLTKLEYIEVFLVSGSPEERKKHLGDIIGQQTPRIILCSIQYRADVTQTIDYFRQHDYAIYTQWLNPGFSDPGQQPDALALMPYLLDRGAVISVRDGKVAPAIRVQELSDFLYGWARSRGLLLT